MRDLVQEARAFAINWHSSLGDIDPLTGASYCCHLRAVAILVQGTGAPRYAVAAAWLHDTIRELKLTEEALFWRFGVDILRLVLEVTDSARPADRKLTDRDEHFRDHVARASSLGKTLAAADLVDKLSNRAANGITVGITELAHLQGLLVCLSGADEGLLKLAVKMIGGLARSYPP